MDPDNSGPDAIVVETSPAVVEPSHTPPQTPPAKKADPIQSASDHTPPQQPSPPDSLVFAQPNSLTPPRVNGNRKPRLDTNTSASGASSSLSTTDDDDATGSSSDSSDSEDDLLNSSTATVEPDDVVDVDVNVDCDANAEETPPPITVAHHNSELLDDELFEDADEYPDYDGEQADAVVTQAESLVADGVVLQDEDLDLPDDSHSNVVATQQDVDLPTENIEETASAESIDEQATDTRTLSIDDAPEQRNYDNSDSESVHIEAEPIENPIVAADIAFYLGECAKQNSLPTSVNDVDALHVDSTAVDENEMEPTLDSCIVHEAEHNDRVPDVEDVLVEECAADVQVVCDGFVLEPDTNPIDQPVVEDAPNWSDRNGDAVQEQRIGEELARNGEAVQEQRIDEELADESARNGDAVQEQRIDEEFAEELARNGDAVQEQRIDEELAEELPRNEDAVQEQSIDEEFATDTNNEVDNAEPDVALDSSLQNLHVETDYTFENAEVETSNIESDKSVRNSDDNESEEPSDGDQSDDTQSEAEEPVENQLELDRAQSEDTHGAEDMDLEEEMPPSHVDNVDELTLSAPVSPQTQQPVLETPLSSVPSLPTPFESLPSFVETEQPSNHIEPSEPVAIESTSTPMIEETINDTSTSQLNNNGSPTQCFSNPPELNDKSEELESMIMSPPSFKSTDEMKYFLKHQLQFSDLGKLFGNVDIPSVMGSGQVSDYAQYLGLQPSVKFKCFKCADSTFASLADLKQHQTKCLKQKLDDPLRVASSPRGSSAAGLRSSLNSDNAMDVDLLASNNDNQSTALQPNPDNQQIDAKIRITRKVYLCSSCGTYYENWNLFFHMREVHQKFICLLCLGIFPSAERLVHHLEGKHNARPDVFEHKEQLLSTLKDQCYMMCTVCEHIFSEHDDFTSHSCENYIKACALCGLKFIHKPQCKAGASGKALARQRKEKLKSKNRHKKLLAGAPKAAATTDDAALDAGESSGLNFSNTLFGASSTSSINGLGSYNFELPQSILSNQTPDAPGNSYAVPPLLAPEAPLSYLPQKLLQDDKPPEYPTNSSSSSVSSSSFAPIAAAPNQPTLVRSAGKIWPPPLDNGYAESNKTNLFNNIDPSQANVLSTGAPPNTVSGKSISLFQQHRVSISEDYLDNRDMEIINSYINECESFGQSSQDNGKNVSLTEIEPMQVKSPSPPPPVASEPPRLVPKLKLNLSKAFQTPIESEESSTESDEEEEEEDVADEEAEEEEEEEEIGKSYQTPSNASRTPHPATPHSFAPSSIPPPTPPHLHRSQADSDMQIDVEQTTDIANSIVHGDGPPIAFNEMATNDEDEDVNIEDEERPTEVQPPAAPLVPFDGIHLADEDTQLIELLLPKPLDHIPILDFLRVCIKATFPTCLYCNHSRKIAVNGHHLALHILAHHRFNATVDSITAEELHPGTIVQRIKSQLDHLTADVFFNLDTFSTVDPANNIISPKSFECFQCRFQARHHKDLYLHNRKMHLKTIVVCLMCKANFYSFSELSGHLCPGHVNPTEHLDVHFRCVLCNLDRIPSAFRLMVHLRKKHGACDICLEYCNDQSRLSSHVCKHKLHHLCYRCGISYRNKADITKHLFWKHGTESQLCKKCMQKKWPHVYHFCVPPASFVCDVCSTTFRRAVALKVHKRLHTDDHPYPCTEDGCEKKFISRKLLLKHVARHSAIDEPEEAKPVEPVLPVAEKKPEEMLKVDSATAEAAKPAEEEEKAPAPKPLIDIIKDLPAPNLSESDSSDESDNEQHSRPASRSLLLKPSNTATIDEEEQQAPVAGIWDNFKSFQAKQFNASDDRDPDPIPPAMLHVTQSDHDYCSMYQKIAPRPKAPIPLIEIKQEPIDDYETTPAVPASPVAAAHAGKIAQSKLNKSPKKGRSPKKALDRSGSDSSSSDSDSSCSCGSNCSCSSSSGDSSSSSSSSSDADSSSSEGRRKKAEKLAKRTLATATANQKPDDSAENVVDVVTAEPIAKPNNDPDLIIIESDLDTDESETDEEFYDEHPQRMANQLLAEKRKQLMLQTSMNPLNHFDIVENSRPSTPSLPPTEEESKARKQKGKKRKKDRKNSKCVPSLKLNLAAGSVSVMDENIGTGLLQPTAFPIVARQMIVQPANTIAPGAHSVDTNLNRFTSNFPLQKVPANIKYGLKPRLSTGSSCSDADPTLKRSKRRRIPNKFYGYTSDEETTPTASSVNNPMDAFKPQPPPNLTWCKEDLPQTPTVIRTPPIKTIIKLQGGLNNASRSASLDYSSIVESNSRFKTSSPLLDHPPALPARHSQPPIPPIIIRPNRSALQPPLVEPLRVPAVPVHHIVPPTKLTTEQDSDSSESDSSNDGHLEIQQTPTPTTFHHNPPPFQRTTAIAASRSTPSAPIAKTPKPRATASRKRAAPRGSLNSSTPKAKRLAKSNTPKTPAIPAQYLPFMMDPQPAVPPPRPAIAHIPLAAMANQIRYPIMPPAGCRPARAGESVYCYCRCPYDEVSEMIACDGDNCPIEWFHFECVNIMVPPKGTWYCPQCRTKYPSPTDDEDDLPDGT